MIVAAAGHLLQLAAFNSSLYVAKTLIKLEMSSLNYTADSIKKQSVTKIEIKQVMLQYTHVKRYKVNKVMLKH